MSYYLINNQPVFLTNSRYRKISKIIAKGKDTLWEMKSIMAGSKESEVRDKLMFEFLLKEYSKNLNNFKKNWVNFDLGDDEATENVWSLLYDHCRFYEHKLFLSDLRDDVEKFLSDYEGDSPSGPMGSVFTIDSFVNFSKKQWISIYKKKDFKVRFYINSEKIQQIEGSLDNFTVLADDYTLVCNDELLIFPHSFFREEDYLINEK